MRTLVALLLMTATLSFAPAADAHQCNGMDCGPCVKGEMHQHNDARGGQCNSGPGYLQENGYTGQTNSVPAPALGGLVAAFAAVALLARRS